MTWFRVEASLRDHTVLGAIAQALNIRPAEAAGLYILTLAGFAEHEWSGRPERVTDVDLEGWARWQGRRGRFARLFRDRFIETRDGQKDPVGQIKGWWRQAALFRKQAADAGKPSDSIAHPSPTNPRQSSDKSATNQRPSVNGSSGYEDEDEDGNGSRLLANGSARETDPTRYTMRCTVAANRGLRENPLVQRFNEMVSSTQDEPLLWLRDGVPIDVAEAAIYHRAKAYRPRGRRTQPTTLGYFRDAVSDAWAKTQGREMEAGVNTTPLPEAESADEYELAARRLEAQERSHAT